MSDPLVEKMVEHGSHPRLNSSRDKYFGKSPSLIQILKEKEEGEGCESCPIERKNIEQMVMEASEDFNQIRGLESALVRKSPPLARVDHIPNRRHLNARELSSQSVHTPQILSPPSPIRKIKNDWDIGISERWNISETDFKNWNKERMEPPKKVTLNASSKTINHETVDNFDIDQNDTDDPLCFLFRSDKNEDPYEKYISEIGSEEDSMLPRTPPRVRRKPWHHEKNNQDVLNKPKSSTWLTLETSLNKGDAETSTQERNQSKSIALEQKNKQPNETDKPPTCTNQREDESYRNNESYAKSKFDTSTPIFGDEESCEEVAVKCNTYELSINENGNEIDDGNIGSTLDETDVDLLKTEDRNKWSSRYEQKKTKIYFLFSPNINFKHFTKEDPSLVEVSISKQKCFSYVLRCLCIIMIISLFTVIVVNFPRSTTNSDSGTLQSQSEVSHLLTFYAIANTPNTQKGKEILSETILDLSPEAQFGVHVGGIISTVDQCNSTVYNRFEEILRLSPVPFLAIPGDQDWSSCANPHIALESWRTSLGTLGEHISRQPERPENFAFLINDVLILGLNIIGKYSRHGGVEQEQQDNDNIHWTKLNLDLYQESVRAVIIFGHAAPNVSQYEGFFHHLKDGFNYGNGNIPILYVHGELGQSNLSNDIYYPYVDMDINLYAAQVKSRGIESPLRVMLKENGEGPATFVLDQGTDQLLL